MAAAPPSPDPSELSPDALQPLRDLKRKRSLDGEGPVTPPLSIDDSANAQLLERAVHVLSTEATALSTVTMLYQTEPAARNGFLRAVDCIAKLNEKGGKLIICGIGKSGLVGMKTVATMKSLGLATSFMHAGEAMHGDLGDIRANDAMLFITFSGKTSELLHCIDHVPTEIPILVLTSHTDVLDCALVAERPDAILLPAPIHESEETSFGVSAPTTSTTVAMAVGDMLAITAAERVHEEIGTASVFRKNHPGGAIGERARKQLRT